MARAMCMWPIPATTSSGRSRPGGAVSVFAGQTGNAGYADGAATSQALFNGPSSVAVDSQGDVYVADFGNSVVRKISRGTVSTVAGQADVAGYLDGLGQNALFNAPVGVAVDGSNNLYIADSQVPPQGSTAAGNDVVRRLTPAGVVSTVAGEAGTTGSADGAGTAAQFYSLQALATGSAGLVYLADTYNQTIRAGQGGATESTTKIISLAGDMEFGDVAVGETGTSTLTISNSGNTALTVSGISYPGGFSGDWASGIIAAGDSQNVDVTFTPAKAEGYAGNIVVSSDATSGTGSITASGNGVTVSPAPSVTTGSATGIAGSSATLNGLVNPNGGSTTVYFNYGTTPSYGSVSASTSAGAGSSLEPFAVNVSGLTPSTLYYFQAVASSNGGTVTGAQGTFTTTSYSTIKVAATGDVAPGVSGALYSKFGNPAINAADGVAFQATLAAGASVAAYNNAGIWAANGSGTRQLVARTSTFAPGTDSAQFLKFSDPVYNNHGAVAFLGTLRVTAGRASAGTATGLWSNGGGTLGLVARQGSQAPGFAAGVTFKTFNAIALPDQGGVIFDATLSNGAQGIWAGPPAGSVTLLAQTGGMINAETITKIAFLPAPPYVNGQSRSFAQGTGDIAYRATFADKTSGIVVVAGSNTTLPVESQEAAPGAPGAEFASFGYPSINANDYVAFGAKLTGAPAADNGGIWADGTNGVLGLVTRTGSAAPGTDAVFKALSDPVYNDNEAVAFRGTLKVAAGQATGATATGVWSNSGGAMALVARQGGQAPGCQAGATFHAFTSLALPNQGGVIFLATLNTNAAADVNATNKTGIWAVDTNGNLQLIVRTGAIVGGQEIKTLSFLPILLHLGGQSRNFTQGTGDVAYLVTFSDKTSAIYVVSFQ